MGVFSTLAGAGEGGVMADAIGIDVVDIGCGRLTPRAASAMDRSSPVVPSQKASS